MFVRRNNINTYFNLLVLVVFTLEINKSCQLLVQKCFQDQNINTISNTQNILNIDIQEQFGQLNVNYQPCCPSTPQQIRGGYFFHLPKCGGTSVKHLLDQTFEKNNYNICDRQTNLEILNGRTEYGCTKYSDEVFEKIYQNRYLNQCQHISSHYDITLIDKLPIFDKAEQKQILDVIVLREPVSRLLSRLSVLAVDNKINIYSRKILDVRRFLYFIRGQGNRILWYLSGHMGCFRDQELIHKYDELITEAQTWYWDEKFKEAVENLMQFCVIIILEKPECGLARLEKTFGMNVSLEMLYENKGYTEKFPQIYVNASKFVTQYDQKLYQVAIEINSQNCKLLGIKE